MSNYLCDYPHNYCAENNQARADEQSILSNRARSLEERIKFLETMLTNLCSALDVDPVKLHNDTVKELEQAAQAERASRAKRRNGPLRIKRKR